MTAARGEIRRAPTGLQSVKRRVLALLDDIDPVWAFLNLPPSTGFKAWLGCNWRYSRKRHYQHKHKRKNTKELSMHDLYLLIKKESDVKLLVQY